MISLNSLILFLANLRSWLDNSNGNLFTNHKIRLDTTLIPKWSAKWPSIVCLWKRSICRASCKLAHGSVQAVAVCSVCWLNQFVKWQWIGQFPHIFYRLTIFSNSVTFVLLTTTRQICASRSLRTLLIQVFLWLAHKGRHSFSRSLVRLKWFSDQFQKIWTN